MGQPIDIADYDAVVSDIYEAALSPARWDVALTNLVGRFGRDHWDVAMLCGNGCTRPPVASSARAGCMRWRAPG